MNNDFIKYIKIECAKQNVEVVIKPYGQIDYNGIFCNGYFCDIKKELAFWYDPLKLGWFLVAVHEFAHFIQWSTNREYWDALVHDKNHSVNLIDDWLGGTEFDELKLNQIINNNIELEYNCEKRAVELIKTFQLEIDINDYIQKANSYVLFYHLIKKQRKFYEKNKEPYVIEAIYKKMPTYFLDNPFSGTQVEELIKIIEDEYKRLDT